ncbi:MAG: metallophosphoesterase [Candidatus Marinimicrobia bacterium]|nr:metallophosphoesterase [Candidatus Neomarinimicrobiota bacterium]MBT3632026.1 metallophosphoesterase [Candidatus Neomarinimicrobiota bacterium]MBT3824612.1 metallophosphoesterase [Candidatus Neomarinimicrobiota bacterium]MBT4130214.1 metallophosphoesterase [Candidatus Neomarinimicrobiota bacterium]MBT4296964.1 metallophosphoesterase [Candidatus Neomarinimicrobiota bacterium]
MFFIIVVFVMTILYGYVGARVIAPFDISGVSLVVYWTVIVLLAITPIAGMILRSRGLENLFIDSFLWLGFIGMGLFSLAFIAFIVRDLGWVTGTLSFNILKTITSSSPSSIQLDPGRRQFLLMSMNLGIVGVTSLLGGIGLFQARRKASIITQNIAIEKLPSEFEGLTIAQISDLHVGPTIKADYARTVVDQVNALQPDLIFFTGDMVDGSVDRLSEDVEPLRYLKSKYGTYFVTGNHEYYSGAEQWVDKVHELGMIHLENEHRILKKGKASLAIAGVTDLMAHHTIKSHKTDPHKAMRGIPDDMPSIMLAHQPGTVELTQGLSIDLLVSGHTHGGQFMPFNLAVAKAHKYYAGLYNHGTMQVYVNRGTGYWGPPLRLGIPSEITLFKLSSVEIDIS